MFEDIKLKLEDVVVKSSLKWMVMPLHQNLSKIDATMTIASTGELRAVLKSIESKYVLLFLTHFLSLQRLKQLFEMVESIKRGLNTDLKILGLPPTRHTNRTNMNIETLKLLNPIYSGF